MASTLTRYLILAAALFFVVTGIPGRKGRKGKGGGRGSKKINNKGSSGGGLVTCPGFAGYCSESYPGDTCLVVCAFGRNNVPVCQEDGTWTEKPRCIEHEPGKPEQIPGQCPGVPGYCSLDLPGGLCTFECITGPHIRSECTADGTWDPYPKCEGDVRETKDGCDPCPGPFGGPRNRTAEAGGSRGSGSQRPKASGGKRPSASGASRGGSPKKNGGRNKGANRAGSRKPSNNRRGPGSNRNKQNGGRKNNRNGGGKRKSQAGGSGGCPDSVLEACIDACPGANAGIFKSCVNGCSKRCS